ncbi:SAM domain (Sterile alpha motif) domain containing protein, variant 2 [Balamuthia mandrillaris]
MQGPVKSSQAIKTEVEQKIQEVKREIQEVEQKIQELEQKILTYSDEHLRSAATALLPSFVQRQVKLHALLNTLTERLQEHYETDRGTAASTSSGLEAPFSNLHVNPPSLLPEKGKDPTPATGSPLRPVTNVDIKRLEERMMGEVQKATSEVQKATSELQTATSEMQTATSEMQKATHRDRTERSTPSTFAERYQRLPVKNKVVEPWFPIRRNQRKAKGGKPLFPPRGYPDAGASESKVVQPYWSSQLKLLVKLFPDLPVTLVDTYNKVSFGRRKPDVVGYLKDKPKSIFYITLLGDVKARRTATKEDFDDSEKGHLHSFLEELLLEYQPYRSVVNGFLTDGCLIQFFRLQKLSTTDQWTESPILHLHSDGGKWLLGLLQSNKAAHGLPEDIVIDEEPVIMNELLGIGGSAVVYSGQYKGDTVVVKRFNSADNLYYLQNEKRCLEEVQDLVPSVPTLVADDEEQLVLLLSPVGGHFASRLSHCTNHNTTMLAMADDFCQLVDILEQVHHNYGLVHRDVRLSNCFRHLDTGTVFLNDWGCATKVGKKVKFSGALQYAPEHVVQCWHLNKTYESTFAHDLEMVVKSVFQTLFFTTFEEIRVEEKAEKIIKFWRYHLAPTIWSSMLTTAQKGDYESLRKQIRDLLPGSTNAG